MMERARIVLGNSTLAGYPEAGGLWLGFLQHFLGLKALGHDVYWLESLYSTGDDALDQRLIATFLERMAEFGLDDRCVLALHQRSARVCDLKSASVYGLGPARARALIASADVLWNFGSALPAGLRDEFRCLKVLVDGDPGHLQVSALSWDIGLQAHDVFLTVGTNIHAAGCRVPTLDRTWHTFVPPVHLPMWTVDLSRTESAPVTSVTQWSWGEVWLGEEVLSTGKRDAYLRYLDLPCRTKVPFELAANLDPSDTEDRQLLKSHGWQLADPHVVASTPAGYQDYIRRSCAELSCPKPIYRELRTGWVSDRSACYLASGRPVLAEDTGFTVHLPSGTGLISFHSADEALEGVAAITRDYERHRRAARAFAEEHLDAAHVLGGMLAACGF
jgi:hypothetical protein